MGRNTLTARMEEDFTFLWQALDQMSGSLILEQFLGLLLYLTVSVSLQFIIQFLTSQLLTVYFYLPPALDYVASEELGDQHIDSQQIEKYLGDQRGIQGHQNSCYLDATVFGLFALSDVFDSMFLKNPTNPTEHDVSSILWKRIVNPLRKLVSVEHAFSFTCRDNEVYS